MKNYPNPYPKKSPIMQLIEVDGKLPRPRAPSQLKSLRATSPSETIENNVTSPLSATGNSNNLLQKSFASRNSPMNLQNSNIWRTNNDLMSSAGLSSSMTSNFQLVATLKEKARNDAELKRASDYSRRSRKNQSPVNKMLASEMVTSSADARQRAKTLLNSDQLQGWSTVHSVMSSETGLKGKNAKSNTDVASTVAQPDIISQLGGAGSVN